MSLNGLSFLNLEITTSCNKTCWMCSRRTAPLDIEYGDMGFGLLKDIAKQTPSGIILQFHGNGEPLLYPKLVDVMYLFKDQIKCITTNGKLLVKKAYDIIGLVDTLSISIFEGDDEAREQLEIIEQFITIKGDKKPFTNLKLIGDVSETPYLDLCLPIIRRQIHIEESSWAYTTKASVVPEIGICWDFLSHPCIYRNGDMSICVRYDPLELGVLGNLNNNTLDELWNGENRMEWLDLHKQGKRGYIPLCSRCDYWGIPTV